MREIRPYGSEGGEAGKTGLPYPYQGKNLSDDSPTAVSRMNTEIGGPVTSKQDAMLIRFLPQSLAQGRLGYAQHPCRRSLVSAGTQQRFLHQEAVAFLHGGQGIGEDRLH